MGSHTSAMPNLINKDAEKLKKIITIKRWYHTKMRFKGFLFEVLKVIYLHFNPKNSIMPNIGIIL